MVKSIRLLAVPYVIISVAVCGSAVAGIDVFTVDPSEPTCDEQMTFHVAGSFGDGCWEVTSIDFFYSDESLGFIIYAVDHWEPGVNCTDALITYSATEVVDPPASGSYYGLAVENIESLRIENGDQAFVPVLACCPGNEAPVTDLRLNKVHDGTRLQFTWSNVPGAESFHLYGDDEPDGPFAMQLGTTSNFSMELPTALLPGFFLLSQSSACGEGPKH